MVLANLGSSAYSARSICSSRRCSCSESGIRAPPTSVQRMTEKVPSQDRHTRGLWVAERSADPSADPHDRQTVPPRLMSEEAVGEEAPFLRSFPGGRQGHLVDAAEDQTGCGGSTSVAGRTTPAPKRREARSTAWS